MGITLSDGDNVLSDDMEEVLAYTRNLERMQHQVAGRVSGDADRDLRAQIEAGETELQRLAYDIAQLNKSYKEKASRIKELKDMLQARSNSHAGPNTTTRGNIDYQQDKFDWDKALASKAKECFGIDSFRLCQRGACNANMDGRDIVCVMPTGGGKSLTYQLPALLTAGCTIIVSPLISLIEDQVMNLKSRGIEAVMLLGSTKQSEKKEIMQRLRNMATGDMRGSKEIKLCYVTPEKLVKDNFFSSVLSALYDAKKLSRFVIDEAHCISSYGHDFRTDYGKLQMLRMTWPSVPIMALSATCPPKVLSDITKSLKLRDAIDGRDAPRLGTVFFSAPLYRKNLLYKVLPKPAKSDELLKAIVEYILTKHLNESGIIYCYSKADTETCAQKVRELSNNRILTGAYHADVPPDKKHDIHEAWRAGRIQVVCATIAFGMGIDKGDVRFVIHQSISKSLDGFYQESGRAGRDGKNADCVTYYRPQDLSIMSGLVSTKENEGQNKLHDVLRFLEDYDECRKILFAKYFRHSSQLSINSWTTEESGAMQKCGHCDNCTRSPESIVRKDVTLAAWKILRIVSEVERMNGKLTLSMLASLVRGKGGSKIGVSKGRGSSKDTVHVDLDRVCEGPVDLTQDETEHLLVQLVFEKYLKESFSVTAYSTNVYLVPGQQSSTYTRFTKEDVLASRKFQMTFLAVEKKARAKKATTATTATKKAPTSTLPKKRTSTDRKGKGKAKAATKDADDGSESGEYINPDEGLEDYVTSDSDDGGSLIPPAPPPKPKHMRRPKGPFSPPSPPPLPPSPPKAATKPPLRVYGSVAQLARPERLQESRSAPTSKQSQSTAEIIEISDMDSGTSDDDDEDDGWMVNQRGERRPPPRKRARCSTEVISVSD